MHFDPFKEGLLVNEHTTTGTLNYAVKAVCLCMEYKVTESPLRRPLVVIVPLGNWD